MVKVVYPIDVPTLISKMVRARGGDPKEINNGWCLGFAASLAQKLGPTATVEKSTDHRGVFPGHYWVKFQGKHYDAESPEGVGKPSQLAYSKRLYKIMRGK